MDYSNFRQNIILLPDKEKKLKVIRFHPWTKYETTSKVLDIAFIEFSEGFQLSEKERLNIWDRIDPNGVRVLPNEKFSTHSKSIYRTRPIITHSLYIYYPIFIFG